MASEGQPVGYHVARTRQGWAGYVRVADWWWSADGPVTAVGEVASGWSLVGGPEYRDHPDPWSVAHRRLAGDPV